MALRVPDEAMREWYASQGVSWAPDRRPDPEERADRCAKRAAWLAERGKTDEALVMAILALEARIEDHGMRTQP